MCPWVSFASSLGLFSLLGYPSRGADAKVVSGEAWSPFPRVYPETNRNAIPNPGPRPSRLPFLGEAVALQAECAQRIGLTLNVPGSNPVAFHL